MNEPEESIEPKDLAEWQQTARPFMTRVVVVLAAFFFIASLAQLIYINWELAHPPAIATPLLDDRVCAAQAGRPAPSPAECVALQRGRALLLLEANVVERRYHLSNALMMFAVWSRYLGFVTGMILAIVGAAFILGKLAEPESRLAAGAPGGWKAEIRSTSPGLVLCFLGVVLIVTAIVTLHSLTTRDASTYIMPINPTDDGGPIVLPGAADEEASPALAPANGAGESDPIVLPPAPATGNRNE